MIYIIDANNLAGKLRILHENDFDRILIGYIREYKRSKNNHFYLVFDSNDPYGDKYTKDGITIIRTPRDNFYKSADDKLIELTRDLIKKVHDNITVVSDDVEIKKEAEIISKEQNKSIIIVGATDFANRLIIRLDKMRYNNEEDEDLNEDEKEDINKELLNLWK